MEPKTEKPLALRPRDAAKALGISQRTLWTWTSDGKIEHARVGRAVLYPLAGLERFLKANAKGGEQC